MVRLSICVFIPFLFCQLACITAQQPPKVPPIPPPYFGYDRYYMQGCTPSTSSSVVLTPICVGVPNGRNADGKEIFVHCEVVQNQNEWWCKERWLPTLLDPTIHKKREIVGIVTAAAPFLCIAPMCMPDSCTDGSFECTADEICTGTAPSWTCTVALTPLTVNPATPCGTPTECSSYCGLLYNGPASCTPCVNRCE